MNARTTSLAIALLLASGTACHRERATTAPTARSATTPPPVVVGESAPARGDDAAARGSRMTTDRPALRWNANRPVGDDSHRRFIDSLRQ